MAGSPGFWPAIRAGVGWSISDDVLRRTTTAHTHTVSEYETPYDGTAREDYRGAVTGPVPEQIDWVAQYRPDEPALETLRATADHGRDGDGR